MKTIRILALASLLCLALTSCEKDTCCPLKVTTGDATNVTSTSYSLNATFEWEEKEHPQGFGAVYYGKANNLSVENHLGSTDLNKLENGTTFYHHSVDHTNIIINVKDGSQRAELFSPGDTMYYRAYAKVNTDAGHICYIYGEEKFVVISKE